MRVINERMKLDKGKQGCMQVGANFARTHAFASIHVVDQAEYNRQCSAGGAQPMCASLERQDALAAESAPSTTPDIRNRRANLLERRSTGARRRLQQRVADPVPRPDAAATLLLVARGCRRQRRRWPVVLRLHGHGLLGPSLGGHSRRSRGRGSSRLSLLRG